MTDFSPVSPRQPSTFPWDRLLRYLALGVVANAMVWGFAIFFLKKEKPVYTSEWTLTIPGAVSTTSVNVPGLGSAVDQPKAPFNDAYDPREIYKAILSGDPVLSTATDLLNLPDVKVKKPRVEIVDNTTLMTLAMTGSTPEEAQKKAEALNEAFQVRLNELRLQEASRKEAAIQTVLKDARRKLDAAQARLSEYRSQTGFISDNQITQISNTVEELRRQRAATLGNRRQSNARLSQIVRTTKLNPSQAADAFALKEDPLFRLHVQNYSEANAALTVLNSKFGPKHPVVRREQARLAAAESAMLGRGQQLLGRPLNESTIIQLNLGDGEGSPQQELLHFMVREQAEETGFTAQAGELDLQIAQLERQLRVLAQQSAVMDSLRRDVQISETVFSSTLARLDVGKQDAFGSYPAVQLLDSPTLPEDPTSPKPKTVYLGAFLCSVLLLSVLASLWTRKRWIPMILPVHQNGRSPEPPILPEPSLLNPMPKSEVGVNRNA